jgi:hypothetical protein
VLTVSSVPDLVRKRRLGQTTLIVKPDQVNRNNATRAELLGVFEYAHLRAPLPSDLVGTGIHAKVTKTDNTTKAVYEGWPDSYFLMVR